MTALFRSGAGRAAHAAGLLVFALAATLAAQTSDRSRAEAQVDRVNERIAVLQREADRLAMQARTLIGDLRALEIERDLQAERLREAAAAVADAEAAVESIGGRIAALEQQRVEQLPNLEAQLVDLYKRGRAGYAQVLFGATSLREFGRATRAVAALVEINRQRIAEHQQTLAALGEERAALEQQVRERQVQQAEAQRARAAAERAVAARNALIDEIDQRRDLNAQLAGELQVAHQQLRTRVEALIAGRDAEPVVVPVAPFRGTLGWPAEGPVAGRFGQPVTRAGTTTPRNGIEVAAAAGTAVVAVHPGTVSYADAFSGFGNLVILDHGDNDFSLYGYLASTAVREGQAVDSGTELGRVGMAPAGPAGLYFEIRIDGRSVDPVQWLRPR